MGKRTGMIWKTSKRLGTRIHWRSLEQLIHELIISCYIKHPDIVRYMYVRSKPCACAGGNEKYIEILSLAVVWKIISPSNHISLIYCHHWRWPVVHTISCWISIRCTPCPSIQCYPAILLLLGVTVFFFSKSSESRKMNQLNSCKVFQGETDQYTNECLRFCQPTDEESQCFSNESIGNKSSPLLFPNIQ